MRAGPRAADSSCFTGVEGVRTIGSRPLLRCTLRIGHAEDAGARFVPEQGRKATQAVATRWSLRIGPVFRRKHRRRVVARARQIRSMADRVFQSSIQPPSAERTGLRDRGTKTAAR